MINEEEEPTISGGTENDQSGSNSESSSSTESSQQGRSGSSGSGESHKQDPVHNTGDEHMMIDEEGAEIKPDDQV